MTAADIETTVPVTEHKRLCDLVIACLDSQQRYFKSRDSADLRYAKDHERRLRQVAEAALAKINRVPNLFDVGGEG